MKTFLIIYGISLLISISGLSWYTFVKKWIDKNSFFMLLTIIIIACFGIALGICDMIVTIKTFSESLW